MQARSWHCLSWLPSHGIFLESGSRPKATRPAARSIQWISLAILSRSALVIPAKLVLREGGGAGIIPQAEAPFRNWCKKTFVAGVDPRLREDDGGESQKTSNCDTTESGSALTWFRLSG